MGIKDNNVQILELVVSQALMEATVGIEKFHGVSNMFFELCFLKEMVFLVKRDKMSTVTGRHCDVRTNFIAKLFSPCFYHAIVCNNSSASSQSKQCGKDKMQQTQTSQYT